MNVQKTVGRAVGVVIAIAVLASCQQAKDAPQPGSNQVIQPATPARQGLCGFISTATVEKVLGGHIESTKLEETPNGVTTCYYVRDGNLAAGGLTAYCADTGRILAGLLNGATELEGSAPEAYNVNGKGGRVFTITKDGSCVLDLAVIRATDHGAPGADVTKALAAGLLEAFNSARAHKP